MFISFFSFAFLLDVNHSSRLYEILKDNIIILDRTVKDNYIT